MSGYIKISSPELTALDLFFYEKNIGGLDRVATLLDELVESIDKTKLAKDAKDYGQISTVQRY